MVRLCVRPRNDRVLVLVQACDAMHTTSAVKSTLRNTMMRGMGLVLRMMARR